MNEKQEKFLYLAVVKQKLYPEIAAELSVDRKTLSLWWEELKTKREELSAIAQLWRKKCKDIEFEDFHKWYKTTEKKCHYCHITPEGIDKLWKLDPNITKRNRGKNLEIDRKNPNLAYDDTENLVFSCYWCNNAKTDTFTDTEFLKIGKVIEEVWRERLATNNETKTI